jgi:quinol monooxygenase YgiN
MVRLVVSLAINAGQIHAFETTMKEMIAGTEGEAGTLEYDWYLSADRTKCRLVENYLDASAMATHFTGPVVQVLVPKLLGSCGVTGFEVYGEPGPKGREMLAMMHAEIFGAWGGITR